MKKIYFVMSLMLSVALFSCNNSEDLVEPVKQDVKTDDRSDDNKAWEDLRVSVEYLNARTFGECHKGVTRGKVATLLGKIWNKIKEVARADADAAVAALENGNSVDNAVISGIAGSVLNVIGKESKDSVASLRLPACSNYSLTNGTLSDAIPLQRPNPSLLDSIGYFHNHVIIEKYNDNPALFYSQNNCNDSLLYSICSIYATEKGVSAAPFYSSLHNSDVMTAIFNENNGSGLHCLCYLSGVNSQHLDFIHDFVDDLGDLQVSQVKTYTISMINEIDNSNLSSSAKNSLKAGVVTAYASLILWIEYYYMVGEL